MPTFDPVAWQKYKDSNPPPSWGADPARWLQGAVSWKQDPSGEDSWKAYGFTILVFAERWADTMEQMLHDVEGSTVEDVAEPACDEVRSGLGIWRPTGFQYGCAVELLSACWVHGEALRRWHNLKTQIRSEGEQANRLPGAVLDPALLTLGLKEDTDT